MCMTHYENTSYTIVVVYRDYIVKQSLLAVDHSAGFRDSTCRSLTPMLESLAPKQARIRVTLFAETYY